MIIFNSQIDIISYLEIPIGEIVDIIIIFKNYGLKSLNISTVSAMLHNGGQMTKVYKY